MVKKYNKRAWVRIVEAFIAILLITGALLVVLGQGYTDEEDISEEIYSREQLILKSIQNNVTHRDNILNVTNLPIEWDEFDNPQNDLSEIKQIITEKTFYGFLCEAKICEITDDCLQNNETNKEVYSQAATITASREKYNPMQLKLFCWKKQDD